jgi:hypothetical protein
MLPGMIKKKKLMAGGFLISIILPSLVKGPNRIGSDRIGSDFSLLCFSGCMCRTSLQCFVPGTCSAHGCCLHVMLRTISVRSIHTHTFIQYKNAATRLALIWRYIWFYTLPDREHEPIGWNAPSTTYYLIFHDTHTLLLVAFTLRSVFSLGATWGWQSSHVCPPSCYLTSTPFRASFPHFFVLDSISLFSSTLVSSRATHSHEHDCHNTRSYFC